MISYLIFYICFIILSLISAFDIRYLSYKPTFQKSINSNNFDQSMYSNQKYVRRYNQLTLRWVYSGQKGAESKRDAYNSSKELNIKFPAIILVNPFLSQNVGSVARAMLNFGLSELRIVDPKCDILSDESIAIAAGAKEILENAQIFPDITSCIADLNRVMATTIRPRDMTQMIYTPSSAAKVALDPEMILHHKVGILFGRERTG